MTPPDKQPAAETLEEIAERITAEIAKICGCAWESCTRTRGETKAAILSGLHSERERCARVADKEAARSNEEWKAAYKRNDSSPMKVYNGRRLAAEDIADAIRGGK